MDYGRLLGDALELTRRYRFLWLLGLFAGSSTCSPSFNFNTSLPSGTGLPPGTGFPAASREVATSASARNPAVH